MICLLAVGVIFVNSAGLGVAGNEPVGLAGILLGRHTLYAAAALACLVLGSWIRPEAIIQLKGWKSPLPWIAAIILLSVVAVHIPGVGKEVNGARRWIDLGPIGFQPSEIAKWGIPVLLAWWCCVREAELPSFRRGFLMPLIGVSLVCLGIAAEDLGTAVLIMGASLIVLLAAGVRLLHIAALAPLALAAIGALIWLSPYRVNRILAYLDPYADSQGIGYHVVQSMGAISGGGLGGRGLGNSVQKFGYLPEGTTDFIYAIIVEETGVLGAAFVTMLFAVVLLCAISVLGQRDESGSMGLGRFSRLLGLGIVATLALQALINIAVVTGLAPTKGIALPLISRGGTGWMLTAFSLGLLIGMDRTAKGRGTPQPETASAVPACT